MIPATTVPATTVPATTVPTTTVPGTTSVEALARALPRMPLAVLPTPLDAVAAAQEAAR